MSQAGRLALAGITEVVRACEPVSAQSGGAIVVNNDKGFPRSIAFSDDRSSAFRRKVFRLRLVRRCHPESIPNFRLMKAGLRTLCEFR